MDGSNKNDPSQGDVCHSTFLNWRQIFSGALTLVCTAGTFTDKTFSLSLFTSNNPLTHLHSAGEAEIWRVKLRAGWQGE